MAKKRIKKFQRHIRINGKMVESPLFISQRDADDWYNEKLRQKKAIKEGMPFLAGKGPLFRDYVHNIWLPKRKRGYPQSTWASDEQRLRDYVSRPLGAHRISKINSAQVKECLAAVVDVHGRDIKTRDRVRALISKIFSGAMNEAPPLITSNPVHGIEFDDPPSVKKKPNYIKTDEDIVLFLRTARSLSAAHFVAASLFIMAGPRKSEAIPLLWADFSPATRELIINKRYMQVANKIVPGTKSGEAERVLSISDPLVEILVWHRANSPHAGEKDFILAKADGRNFGPRDINRLMDAVYDVCGVKMSPHAGRHTRGRQFAKKSGNIKVLQSMLGHASATTTEIYSELSGRETSEYRNIGSFEVGDDE